MSKSSPDVSSRILLTDTDAQIKSKIRSAVTDSIREISYDPISRPGTSNLLTILAACTDQDVNDVAARYANKGHGALKGDVSDAISELLREPRAEFEKLSKDPGFLEQVAKEGAEKAHARSEGTIREVRKLIGLV